MAGRPSVAGEWRVVSRRKNKQSESLSSFYVGNIPEGATTDDLKAKFTGFGKLEDVYIARKKDRGGLNFGFIKYAGVQDEKKMEECFGKINLGNNILTINIARFQRKSSPIQATRQNITRAPPPPPPTSVWNLRGQKSFASTVSGSKLNAGSAPIRVNLTPSEELDKNLFSSFVFGEIHDSMMLKALPNLLKDAGILFKKLFFYGGLCVLISFNEEEEVAGLLGNYECWKNWFTWLKKGDSILNWKFERAVDIKIVGLPLQFRTPENIRKILSHHGRILTMEDDLWKNEDLSSIEVCMLMESRLKINEEIIINYGSGKQLSIGVFEQDRHLKPFGDDRSWGDDSQHEYEDEDDDASNDCEDDNESEGI